jgi:hypothetical protein
MNGSEENKMKRPEIGVPAETMLHIFPSASKLPSHIDCICFQVQTHLDGYPVWYIRNLPENGGDFEWTEDPAKAKLLGRFWQKRFLSFCRSDYDRPNYGCIPVCAFRDENEMNNQPKIGEDDMERARRYGKGDQKFAKETK